MEALVRKTMELGPTGPKLMKNIFLRKYKFAFSFMFSGCAADGCNIEQFVHFYLQLQKTVNQ